MKYLLFSHGFGVKKDSRGMFTEIAEKFPEYKPVMFDYNVINEETNEVTVEPYSKQSELLSAELNSIYKSDTDAEITLICHSQGCIIPCLLKDIKLERAVLLAPPKILGSNMSRNKNAVKSRKIRPFKRKVRGLDIENGGFEQSDDKTQKHIHKLFRVGVDFEQNRQSVDSLKIDPYFLGLLLGDGSFLGTPNIATTNKAIVQEIKKQAKFYRLTVRKRVVKNKCPQYALVKGRKYSFGRHGGSNILINRLRFFKLWGKKCDNKFIPQVYKTSTRENRLAILAGLLDTDGCLQKNYFEITQKSKSLYKTEMIQRQMIT
jgi:hypothetical protein